MLEENRTGAFNLIYEPMPTYREFVSRVRAGKRTLFLPIPTGIALALTRSAEALHVPLPVRSGQIRALEANAGSLRISDLATLVLRQTELKL